MSYSECPKCGTILDATNTPGELACPNEDCDGPGRTDGNAWNASGDNAITPEFINAIRVYRSGDDVEMSLADQFRVIADRIEDDKP